MKILKIVGGFLALAIPACATPSNCAVNTLTSYLANNFSCTIGDKTYADFAAALTGVSVLGTATPISTDDIQVQPTGGSSNPGFSFAASYDAISGPASVSSVSFTVAYTGFAPANDPFTETSLFLTNPAVSGLGAITAAEALCKNGSFTSPLNPLLCDSVVVNAGLTSNITNANLNALVTFSLDKVTELGVIKQLTLTSGVTGSASVDKLNNGYQATAVPEPGTIAFMSGGLVFLLRCRKRLRRRA